MATSQNGYSANDRSVIATYTVPGTTLRVALRKGDVSVVLLEFLRRYHREVESLYNTPQDLWGYAERTIRGSSTTLSNHASGTAVDVRATAHPLGVRGTFPPQKLAALRRVLADFGGVLRWGGDYSGRPDEMHIEINAGAAAVKRLADAIRGSTTAVPTTGDDDMTPEQAGQLALLVRQLVTGNDLAAPPDRWGWPGFPGGSGETLTVVDYLRRANVQLEQLHVRLAAIETGKVTPAAGPPVLTDADIDRVADRVIRLLGRKTSA